MTTTDIPLLSSGRHQFLNRQPWALIQQDSDEDGNLLESDSVIQRYQTRREAIADQQYGEHIVGDDPPCTVEFDPIPWDAEPLHHPGNPILADLRRPNDAGELVLDWDMVEWWTRMIDDIVSDWSTTPGYTEHAGRVIRRLRALRD